MNVQPPLQTQTRKRHSSVTHSISCTERRVRVLLFWASWLRSVDELQQRKVNKVSPGLSGAAVDDSRQDLRLIKNAAPLARRHAEGQGSVSFEPRGLQVAQSGVWEVSTLATSEGREGGKGGRDARGSYLKSITCLTTGTGDLWSTLHNARTYYLSCPVWRWHE